MDVLESVLDRLRDSDTRPFPDRLRAAQSSLDHALTAILRGDPQGDQRAAAARAVVDALAVLAGTGGLAADVAAADGGVVPAPAADGTGGRRHTEPPAVHDAPADPDRSPGHDRVGRAHPDRYPDGPAGDWEAFADLEHTDDD